MNYYNEFDAKTAAWLRELIKADLIPAGDVDERSIVDVRPADLAGYTQCHFFAGIGGWSHALDLAGWPRTRSVWTGSCPCQPFSAAGARQGGNDDRHLWPYWARLIAQCRPVAIFGEQVESAIAHGWLDAVVDDLEREGYACGAACLPAGSVGAPHIRQRVWFVAESDGGKQRHCGLQRSRRYLRRTQDAPAGLVADSKHAKRRPQCVDGSDGRDRTDAGRKETHGESGTRGQIHELADATSGGLGINGSAPRHAGHVDERESVK